MRPSRMLLTKNVYHPGPDPSSKTGSTVRELLLLALASRKAKFMATPICVPTTLESQSRVSISSDSHSKKSMGFSIALTRSKSGL